MNRRKHKTGVALLLLLLLIAPPFWVVYRDMRQARLDHALIEAIKTGDDKKALEALAEGANGEARDTGKSPTFRAALLHLWDHFRYPNHQSSTPDEDDQHLPALLLLDSLAFEKAFDSNPWNLHGPNLTLIRELLNHGAKVNDQDRLYNRPLWYATTFANTDTVRMLLERGADLEASSCGRTPQSLWSMRISKSSGKYTPLIWAVRCDRPDVVHLLLEYGAKVSPESTRGRTALDYAKNYPNHESPKIAALLRQYGAK